MFVQVLLLFIGFLLNFCSSKTVSNEAESSLRNPYESLPDIIHKNFPSIPYYFPDILLIIYFFKIIIFEHTKLHNLEHNMYCLSYSFIIRSITTGFTIMPTCMKKISNPNLYTRCFLSTHDLMFSGHSIIFLFLGKIIQSTILQLFGPFLIVVSRQHYTIDVFVSYLIYNQLDIMISRV